MIGNHLLNIFPDLKIGDWLTIKIDGKETKWHIIGTYSITGNVSPPLLYVNYEYLSRLVGQPGQVYSVRVLTVQHDALSQRRISDQIKALYEEHGIGVGSTQLAAEDSVLLSLAIASIQSDHALSTADLSFAGDDGGLVRF